jgi:hypothetical protein
MQALRHAKHLIVAGGHLAEFRDAGVAFADLAPGKKSLAPAGSSVSYKGRTFPYRADSYIAVTARAPAHVLATLSVAGTVAPYIVRDGSATFINGQIDFGDGAFDPNTDGNDVIIADALRVALGAPEPPDQHLAMLRLEDVSVETPVDNLRDIVVALNDLHIAYGIGVIPDQWIQGKRLESLDQDRGLVTILRWAQAHGATIVLHGLHHSYRSAEDFEFWDAAHDRPLPYDSPMWMDGRIEEGLRDERAVGLHPAMWETPHYSASPVDYAQTAKYFSTVWEQRRPLGWSPWVLQRDQYGQRVLPEDLGYIAVDGNPNESLAAQMNRAQALLVCRECVAAGFLHPTTVSADTVREYVERLRAMGYRFADPRMFIASPAPGGAPVIAAEQTTP